MIDEIMVLIYDHQAVMSKALTDLKEGNKKRHTTPLDSDWKERLYQVTFLVPSYALPILKVKGWEFVHINVNAEDAWREGIVTVVPVTFVSSYKTQIIDPLTRIEARQAQQRKRKKSEIAVPFNKEDVKKEAAFRSNKQKEDKTLIGRKTIAGRITKKWSRQLASRPNKTYSLMQVSLFIDDERTASGSLPTSLDDKGVGDWITIRATFKQEKDGSITYSRPTPVDALNH